MNPHHGIEFLTRGRDLEVFQFRMPVFPEFPDFLGTGLLRIGIGSYDRSRQ